MRIETLKNPGALSLGLKLRTVAAQALSACELWMQQAGKDQLAEFFYDCAMRTGGGFTEPTTSTVNSGDQVPVRNSAGTIISEAGVVTVESNEVTGVALPATIAAVKNADVNVPIKNSAGTSITTAGVADVASGVITGIRLPATIAALANAANGVTVQNSAGATKSASSTAVVAGGVLTAIRTPANLAILANAEKIGAITVSGSGTYATFTVANGVVTGIVLSAS